jgi:hypothetical protein
MLVRPPKACRRSAYMSTANDQDANSFKLLGALMPREFWIFHQKNEAMEWREFFPFRERESDTVSILHGTALRHTYLSSLLYWLCANLQLPSTSRWHPQEGTITTSTSICQWIRASLVSLHEEEEIVSLLEWLGVRFPFFVDRVVLRGEEEHMCTIYQYS